MSGTVRRALWWSMPSALVAVLASRPLFEPRGAAPTSGTAAKVAVTVLGIGLIIGAWWRRRPANLAATVATFALVASLLGGFLLIITWLGRLTPAVEESAATTVGPASRPEPPPTPGARSDVTAALAIALLIVAATAAAVLIARRVTVRRQETLGKLHSANATVVAPPDQAAAEVAAALADSALLALDDPDPRVAVIAAYAHLNRALEGVGWGRLHFEGPREHLTRWMAGLGVNPAAAVELTEVFVRARFSGHPITESDRATAHRALESAQHDVLDRATRSGSPGGRS